MEKTREDARCAPSLFYTVRRGDSLAAIARRLKVTPGALIERNPYVDPRALNAGLVLVVPERARAVFARYGQTLSDLLIKYDISYQAFFDANPALDKESIAPGSRVLIPPPGSRGACPEAFYALLPGDTLEKVAKQFGLPIIALLRLNKNMTPEDFLPGRVVKISEKPSRVCF